MEKVFFMPLFYSPNPWIGEVPDRDVMPLSVKVILGPSWIGTFGEEQIRVELVDIFSVTGYMPPYPKTQLNKDNLLETIWEAAEKRTGKAIERFKWDIVIYGGKE